MGDELDNYRAILTWLLEPMQQPEAYVAWIEEALKARDLRLVVMGDVLPDESERFEQAAIRLYAIWGLSFDRSTSRRAFRLRPCR